MKRKKQSLITAVTCILIMLLTGCGGVQVNERMFAQAIDIRREEGDISLIAQIWDTKNDTGSLILSEERGGSFCEAAENVIRNSGRDLFFGHCQAVFTDENVICDPDVLGELLRYGISAGCPVIYSEERLSEDDSGVGNKQEQSAAEGLEVFVEDGIIGEFTLKNALGAASSGSTAAVPLYKSGFEGTVLIENDKVIPLSLTESAVYNILSGADELSLTSSDGKAHLTGMNVKLYHDMSADGSYLVDISGRCAQNGSGSTALETMLARETENFLIKARSKGFIDSVKGFENAGTEKFAVSTKIDFRG